MNIVVIGAAGFIGTNLAIKLSQTNENVITLVDKEQYYFDSIKRLDLHNIKYKVSSLDLNMDYDILNENDVLYDLASTNMPTNSNIDITKDLYENIIFKSKLFEKCVEKNIKKIVFISSGGGVYGKEATSPIDEYAVTNPITSYGLQKITIEKLLYLYNYLHGIQYRIIRLSNPYGPYQRPNGKLGVVTNFIYRAINNQTISVYGDGTVVRDFVYIDDAINAIVNIANSDFDDVYNFGSGVGVSVNSVLNIISKVIGKSLNIEYLPSRKVDVPKNVLNVNKYIKTFGLPRYISLEEGIVKTIDYFNNRS